jgi:hypothetical protein
MESVAVAAWVEPVDGVAAAGTVLALFISVT